MLDRLVAIALKQRLIAVILAAGGLLGWLLSTVSTGVSLWKH